MTRSIARDSFLAPELGHAITLSELKVPAKVLPILLALSLGSVLCSFPGIRSLILGLKGPPQLFLFFRDYETGRCFLQQLRFRRAGLQSANKGPSLNLTGPG